MTPTHIEEWEKRFDEQFVRKEGFGGFGGVATRQTFKLGDNPDFADEIYLDEVKDFIRSLLSRKDEEYVEELHGLLYIPRKMDAHEVIEHMSGNVLALITKHSKKGDL